ncbi:hypothetical protein [Halomonas elongata]|uniref:Uncharacterized protein n=1 Tax=Halomonas elongata (strain ATCC 33173 / DSM 2581 / NBRC 15536 / NCIMB 2198 / 1H9) TaxID=768066 RepID=E1VA21_HALED|nr:hypothetical protein [Halomonas elongata]WBF17646.1 hypothetical protein LM502_16455 [Halomonas elongata]WPU46485.1 hypothetical protein SR933_14685 [Halomonas elongata DSM 2581]CBV43909.1 uncharacterized protein HELO_4025 [Halomonas elongata DSM 2581]
MNPITPDYLRDMARIQQARSCGSQPLEETPAWRAAERIEELEQENRKLHMQYAGAMGLISEMSGHLALSHPEYREPLRDQIIQAAEDWCQLSGWSGRMVGNKLILDPPKQGGAA